MLCEKKIKPNFDVGISTHLKNIAVKILAKCMVMGTLNGDDRPWTDLKSAAKLDTISFKIV